jgi:hypothetical protein
MEHIPLETLQSLKKEPLTPNPVTFKKAKQEKSLMKLLYVISTKVFKKYIVQGYEYCDGYNLRESILRSDIMNLEEKLK